MKASWIVCIVLAGIPLAWGDAGLDRARAERACAARDPSCDWLATLSSLERQSVVRALAARGYTVESSPWGKVIGAVRVYNEAVFAESNRLLQFFNHFHVTTKEHVIARELVIGAGEVWDQERIDESARRLRQPLWTSVVVIIPVASTEPGKIDLLVVTRDIWSLRLNTKYTFQQGTLTNFSVALSENNFLGRRSVFAAGFAMDQGAIATGPVFLNKNLLGKKLDINARFDVIMNRDDLLSATECPRFSSSFEFACRGSGDPSSGRRFTFEGTQSRITLSRPLWSLASEWGLGGSFGHRNAVHREFRGLELLPVDCSSGECTFPVDGQNRLRPILDLARDTPAARIIGVQYAVKAWDVSVSAVRQWGDGLKHQVTLGYSIDRIRARPLSTFPGNPVERSAFIRDFLPRSELTSTPFIGYGLFVPKFKTLRNIDTYDLAEDVRLGPGLEFTYAVGLELLGGDANFHRATGSASWTIPLGGDGYVRPAVGMSSRLQDLERDGEHEFIDNNASASVRIVTPTFRWARVVALLSAATRWHDAQNRRFAIGSDSGLRGFLIDEFRGDRTGDRFVRNQLEIRSVPRPLWIVRVGAVAFYELGGVADTFRSMRLHHDVGAGLRMLIPQTARDLFRFDLAIPLDGVAAGKVRFIAGFESAF